MTKEARIYNEEKTVSSTNNAGKTGQPHVKKKKNQIKSLLNFIHKKKVKMD